MLGNGIATCKKVTDEVFTEMKKLVRECEYRFKSIAPRQVSFPNTGYLLCSYVSNVEQKKRNVMNGPIDRAFQKEAREQCDVEVARMFYVGGLSFHLARNPHYRNSYLRASALPRYVPPGPMFLKGINCDRECKDKHCIANFLIDSIKEIGYQNVVQVITDNAPVCRVAELLVVVGYPNIFWTPCVVQTLNLALKSICSPKQNDDCQHSFFFLFFPYGVVQCPNFPVSMPTLIGKYNMRLAMYKDHCKLKMFSIAERRFASTLVMIRTFKEVKEGLQQMVISPNWSLYKEDDIGKASAINLYFIWFMMIEKVKATIYRKEHKQLHEQSEFFDVVYHILMERWTKSSTSLYCLAHSLNPRFYSPEWLQEDPSCVAPHQVAEITMERKKCLEKYFSDNRTRRYINVEFHMEPMVWWIVHGASTPTVTTRFENKEYSRIRV
ncbi:unnamed protein product [Prunus armeniaca]